MGGWLGGNQVENHATSWSKLQNCKISIRVIIPKLDSSVAKMGGFGDQEVTYLF